MLDRVLSRPGRVKSERDVRPTQNLSRAPTARLMRVRDDLSTRAPVLYVCRGPGGGNDVVWWPRRGVVVHATVDRRSIGVTATRPATTQEQVLDSFDAQLRGCSACG